MTQSIRVGTSTAQAAIDAVDRFGLTTDTAILRLATIALLRTQVDRLRQQWLADMESEEDAELLEAYVAWIDAAVNYYGSTGRASPRDYAHAVARLSAELHLSAARDEQPAFKATTTSGSHTQIEK